MWCHSCLGAVWWTLMFAALLVGGAGARGTAAAQAETPHAGTLAFRLFLKDGTPVATLGECTRANGRVVFALPLGSAGASPPVQLISLPDHAIDWERTSRYTDAVRAKRYADTRGDADFAALTLEITRALTEVAISAEPARKIAIAEEARRRLVEWPRTHYAYRAGDVRELAFAVDETIADIRADLGEQSFTIDLVAMTEVPSEPILPAPSAQESIAHAVAVARLSDIPAERVPLQQLILSILDPKRADLPPAWVSSTRRAVETALRVDERTDLRYSQLVRSSLAEAASRAERADVDAISRLLDEVRREDAKLGGLRPGRMSALLATLESYARVAERRRLQQQLIARRRAEHGAYQRETSTVIRGLRQMEQDMAAIRALAGLDAKRVARLSATLDTYAGSLARLTTPSELRAAHDNLLTSIRLMQEAARLGARSSVDKSAEAAENASAAAAGSQLLLARARMDMASFFDTPQSR